MSEISRVGVVGAGLMGSGIAEVCARAGLDVLVSEITEQAVDAGRQRVERSIGRAQKAGKLSAEEGSGTLARIGFTTSLDDMADRDFVIEAIAEDESLKVDVFSTLDKVLESPDAVLASNTSSIPIMKLAMATQRPHRVIGVHFFNPAPVLRLVELIPSLLTDEQTRSSIEDFVSTKLGKTVVRSTDRAGFVVNALLIPYILSAIRMFESGFASAEDIDNGMVLGCAHPMGPLALADLIGLDTTMAVAESMYEEFKEPLYSPPPMLLRMVDAGLLGKKAGRGFYEYSR
ncbi:3-hydroxybutyryl-CoA dehydrogenase [Pseudonocardia hispaniensis]|uniref:3-hydroxybutyryl-CoA dehydrogenase n=1 Tax=Pseudonocardia hispaniensis TaxID=904933 RepID=A0ABW1J7S4_9PSEU